MTIARLAQRLRRSDEGSSLAAVLMVMMVLSVIGITSVQIARHTNDVTSIDRERLQTVQAAEAGVNDAIRRIEAGAGCDPAALPALSLRDGDDVVGSYRTRVDPESGTTCGQTPRRVIHSWGYAPTGGTRALRHLEVTVALKPQGGFLYTLFAEGSGGTVYVKNGGTIGGDVYAETLDQSKNNLFADDVVSPKSIIALNNASYSGALWSGGDITLGNNGSVGKSIIATGTASGTQGNIVLNGSAVGGDALAKGTVTGGDNVQGTIVQNNSNLTPPPNLVKPAFTWDATNYTPAPVLGTAAQITAALNTSKNNLQGTFRATDTGIVVFPNSVTVTGPLTIIAAGKVDLGQSMSVVGGPFQVVVVAESSAADAINFAKPVTAASGLHLLLYTPGGVDGKNTSSFTGSIYANDIDFKNSFTIQKSTLLETNPPVGFTFDLSSASSFSAVPEIWKEVVPGAPPA